MYEGERFVLSKKLVVGATLPSECGFGAHQKSTWLIRNRHPPLDPHRAVGIALL